MHTNAAYTHMLPLAEAELLIRATYGIEREARYLGLVLLADLAERLEREQQDAPEFEH